MHGGGGRIGGAPGKPNESERKRPKRPAEENSRYASAAAGRYGVAEPAEKRVVAHVPQHVEELGEEEGAGR